MRRPDVRTVVWASTDEVSGVLASVSFWSLALCHVDGTCAEYACSEGIALGAAHLFGQRVTVRLKRSRVASVEVCGG